MVAQFCPFCGQPITASDSRFCAFCGKEYPWASVMSTSASVAPTPANVQAPYGYVPPAPVYEAAPFTSQPPQSAQPAQPQPIAPNMPQPGMSANMPYSAAGYAPVYTAPAPGMPPYMMQGASMRQPGATSPGRLVGVAIGFGVLALILGFLTYFSAFLTIRSFFVANLAGVIAFDGWEVAGLLFWYGLMRSLHAHFGRVLGEMLAVAEGYLLLSLILPMAWLVLRYRELPPLGYYLRFILPAIFIMLLLGLVCWGFVSLAGTWSRARRLGIRPLPVGIYLAIMGATLAPLFLRFLLGYVLYFALPYILRRYLITLTSFQFLAVAELIVFIILGCVMVWQRVKRSQYATASVLPVATPVAPNGAGSMPPSVFPADASIPPGANSM